MPPLRIPDDGFSYPNSERYTFHLIVPPRTGRVINISWARSFNLDATFKSDINVPKPSALLLDYMYGVSILKWYGRGKNIRKLSTNTPELAPLQLTCGRESGCLSADAVDEEFVLQYD